MIAYVQRGRPVALVCQPYNHVRLENLPRLFGKIGGRDESRTGVATTAVALQSIHSQVRRTFWFNETGSRCRVAAGDGGHVMTYTMFLSSALARTTSSKIDHWAQAAGRQVGGGAPIADGWFR